MEARVFAGKFIKGLVQAISNFAISLPEGSKAGVSRSPEPDGVPLQGIVLQTLKCHEISLKMG